MGWRLIYRLVASHDECSLLIAPLSCFAQQPLSLRLQCPAQRAATREVSFGFFHSVLHQPRDAAIAVSAGQTRIDFQRLVEITGRTREIPLCNPNHAAVEPGFSQFRIERKRAVQIAQGAIWLAFRQPRSAAISRVVRLPRMESDGAVEIRNRSVPAGKIFFVFRPPLYNPAAFAQA